MAPLVLTFNEIFVELDTRDNLALLLHFAHACRIREPLSRSLVAFFHLLL